MSRRDAETIRLRVERLVSAQLTGAAPDAETSRWAASLGDRLREKLVGVDLLEGRPSATLGAFIDKYVDEAKAKNRKPRTLKNYQPPFQSLRKHFGNSKPLRAITKGDAAAWRATIGKADNTVRMWTAKAKALFNAALDYELVDQNPFRGLPSKIVPVPERRHFLTVEDSVKVYKACPNAEWRLIFALARWGGLRCPSELVALRWDDVLWDQNRFMVNSPKTGLRVVPLFPELRQAFEEAFEQAEDGAEHVITRTRCAETNLRTQLHRIIKRAGLKPWPKALQNLRLTRSTELRDVYPSHLVAAWLGHTEAVADAHYGQVTEEHFEAAAGQHAANALHYALQQAPTRCCKELSEETRNTVFAASCDALQLLVVQGVPRRGVEPLSPP